MVRFVLWALVLAAICTLPRGTLNAANPEVRALWVQRTTLTSAPAIVSLVETAKAAGFNTLLVQVRGRGDAFYNSRLEPRAAELEDDPQNFDPLALTLRLPHAHGPR